MLTIVGGMRLVVVLLLCGSCVSQTTKPIRKATIAQRLDKLESSLQVTTKSNDDLKAENERLKAANKELSDSNVALTAKYEELRKSAAEVLAFGNRAATEYEKANAINGELVAKYNTLLNQANSIINQQNANLARQQRINNALAIYSAMPRYTPIQLQPPQIIAPPRPINCTSIRNGDYTTTTCN